MKFFYEKFWVPVFGYILSKFVFLIEGKKKVSKNKKQTNYFLSKKYFEIHNLTHNILIMTKKYFKNLNTCMVDINTFFQEIKMTKHKLLKPYTVHYRDFQNIRLENCFYAFDAYEARTLAMEFNKYINEHPNSIDLIRCEK